jgi:tRNA A-37 threonylcarbamoyl transferase component Bud32
MNEALKSYLNNSQAKEVTREVLKEYEKEMKDSIIPQIAEALKERHRLAAEARQWPGTKSPSQR